MAELSWRFFKSRTHAGFAICAPCGKWSAVSWFSNRHLLNYYPGVGPNLFLLSMMVGWRELTWDEAREVLGC